MPVAVDVADVNAVREALGLPSDAALPDVLMDHVSLTHVTLELANLTGDTFGAPVLSVRVD